MSIVENVKPRLMRLASAWIPQMFPKGIKTGGTLRLGDLSGAKGTSLAIALHGSDAGSWIDFATGEMGDCLDLIAQAEGLTNKEALGRAIEIIGGDVREFEAVAAAEQEKQQQLKANRLDYIKRLVKQSKPVKGTIAETYLNSRGITEYCERTLKFLPNHKHQLSGESFPVLLALVQDRNGQGVAIHRTYLKPDGSGKANVEPNKMMLGNVNGGAVRLCGVDDEGIIGVAEGIETALSASMLNDGLPVWAVLSRAGMVNFKLPEDERVAAIAIFRDNDEAGEMASKQLSDSLELLNEIYAPKRGFNDFNDELRAINGKKQTRGKD
ncbi:hypothetical protein VME_45830 [Vibrio harveyi 1DA3]|nr:hypothetical protein VME_45830 [Vibrio harveyi 1DA3]